MGVSVRKIHDGEIPEFRELTLDVIGEYYPDIDSFVENIVEAHQEEYDPLGYFTKTKTIWVAELDDEVIGYLVGTEKRGGSVKLLPGIVKDGYRGQGYGTEMWTQVEDVYRERGHRKTYNHGHLDREELLYWVTGMGMQVEAHLREQYTEGRDEYVVGRILDEGRPEPRFEPERLAGPAREFDVRTYRPSDEDEFESLVVDGMEPWYDEIGTDFVQSILDARERFDERYKRKGKRVYVVETRDGLAGCCVATPKRGGSVKLVPMLFRQGTPEMAKALVRRIETDFVDYGFRKLYILVPTPQLDLISVLKETGFDTEGLLREPYKPGVDNVFMGKFVPGE